MGSSFSALRIANIKRFRPYNRATTCHTGADEAISPPRISFLRKSAYRRFVPKNEQSLPFFGQTKKTQMGKAASPRTFTLLTAISAICQARPS